MARRADSLLLQPVCPRVETSRTGHRVEHRTFPAVVPSRAMPAGARPRGSGAPLAGAGAPTESAVRGGKAGADSTFGIEPVRPRARIFPATFQIMSKETL